MTLWANVIRNSLFLSFSLSLFLSFSLTFTLCPSLFSSLYHFYSNSLTFSLSLSIFLSLSLSRPQYIHRNNLLNLNLKKIASSLLIFHTIFLFVSQKIILCIHYHGLVLKILFACTFCTFHLCHYYSLFVTLFLFVHYTIAALFSSI